MHRKQRASSADAVPLRGWLTARSSEHWAWTVTSTHCGAVTAANYKLFEKSEAITECREFPERTHWTIAHDGWEAVADFALAWAERHVPMAISPTP